MFVLGHNPHVDICVRLVLNYCMISEFLVLGIRYLLKDVAANLVNLERFVCLHVGKSSC